MSDEAKYPPGSIGAMFPVVPQIVEQLTRERDEARAEVERRRVEHNAAMDAAIESARESAESELRSLRGVVQAARELHINDEGDGIAQPFCVHDGRQWPCPTARALAAAADAPQPAETRTLPEVLGLTPEQEAERVASLNADLDRIRDAERAVFHPGPSPAVLPDRKASE